MGLLGEKLVMRQLASFRAHMSGLVQRLVSQDGSHQSVEGALPHSI